MTVPFRRFMPAILVGSLATFASCADGSVAVPSSGIEPLEPALVLGTLTPESSVTTATQLKFFRACSH